MIEKNTPFFTRPQAFFNQDEFRQALASQAVIATFKQALLNANTQFDERFRRGEKIHELILERAVFIDCLLHYAWHQFTWPQTINLIAVGGYGRSELHPYSDIDLLLLVDEIEDDIHRDSIGQFFTLLWDIGLEIGHSVRTVKQCVDMAISDITVVTSIMESRPLMGDPVLHAQLNSLTTPDKIWPADEFFRAKKEEQVLRHNKFKDSEYNLEPNIKNAPGGLRDIQIICWVAKRFFNVSTLRQLRGQNFFTEEEFLALESGEEFLWRVRYGLHMIAKRPEERLLFDHQRELAILFGFTDSDKSLAVEQFMHQYYRQVMSLRVLNDVLLQFLYEVILQRNSHQEITAINKRFQLRNGYIEATNIYVFQETPSAILEVFVLMAKTPEIGGMRASTIRLMRENLHLINNDFRQDPENIQLFLELFEYPEGLAEQLKRMIRYGILGLYLPEFEHTVGQMQHDLFHVYTVDAHTLRVVQNMCNFLHENAMEKFPVAAHVIRRLPKTSLLFLAGLYHDVGKGLGGNHSLLGAQDVEKFAQHHGISKRETRLLSWLVRKHLLMSAVSQKQDISDPTVIHNFALIMGDQLHLDYLYALTVADINATNRNLWTSWRASLMRQLYLETKRALRRGLENKVDKQDWIEETQEAAIARLERHNISREQCWEIWEDVDEEYFLRESYSDIAWHTEAIFKHHSSQPLVLVQETNSHEIVGATQIFARSRGLTHVFSTLVDALDRLNLSIQDARIYKSKTGFTLDTFFVLNQNNQPLNAANLQHIKETLYAELQPNDNHQDVSIRRTPLRLKHFKMPTRTSIRNDIEGGYTLLEVITPDRPRLLACISRIFIDFNIHLQNAKITTLGERVEDIFLITNSDYKPLNDPKLCEDLQKEICRQLDARVDQT